MESTIVPLEAEREDLGAPRSVIDSCGNVVVAWRSSNGYLVTRILTNGAADWVREFATGNGVPSGTIRDISVDGHGNTYLVAESGMFGVDASGEPLQQGDFIGEAAVFLDELEGTHYVGVPGYARVDLPGSPLVPLSEDFGVRSAVDEMTIAGAALSPSRFVRVDLTVPDGGAREVGAPPGMASVLEVWEEAPLTTGSDGPAVRDRALLYSHEFQGELGSWDIGGKRGHSALAYSVLTDVADTSWECSGHLAWLSRGQEYLLDGCWLAQAVEVAEDGSVWTLWINGAEPSGELLALRWSQAQDFPEKVEFQGPPAAAPQLLPFGRLAVAAMGSEPTTAPKMIYLTHDLRALAIHGLAQ